ncbi:ATP-dependent DNA ligase [Mycolicibacterium fluoranthenivorans]|uniref:DNA ligase (ATP) n=1 Tax=Mycolicibacterium fluoranthenivorans TaxID=258505 RepID=A0A7G8PFF0_9MYCO|nr:ATP-dependent DNA ligase [Mycolicibacterium fluoranthenivorans]QNJ93066.1 ATP-dependent DNA ligase [Mycolicibacterium fluoranthenivorans]
MGTVDLPVLPPVDPMLAKAAGKVPDEAGVWSFEPKWDGFRALAFRDGDEVVLQSRSGKELGRYFPELLDALRDELADRCVLDGEVVVPREVDGRVRLDWESLSQRIHPAASRIKILAEQTPAHFIGFDALALGDRSLLAEPFRDRRVALLAAIREKDGQKKWCHVTRTTADPAVGAQWLDTFEGAGLDGVIAKRLEGPYLPGKREMVKIKHHRDADCVALGYRIHKSGAGVGSILLGLYRDDGELQMVGGAASFTAKDRLKLLADLEPLREGDEVRDGDPSRWNSAADKRWIPVRPERVCEVAYDQMEGSASHGQRFRHAVKFLRWRPDREPSSCTFAQLDTPLIYDLHDVLEDRGERSDGRMG